MIDLTSTIVQAQIAFGISVITLVLVYTVFGKKSPRHKKHSA